jgi:hypothetical protein
VAIASFSNSAPRLFAMLAPPQARRLGAGGAATKKEAVNTDSNARFASEVEWNMRGNHRFSLAPPIEK